MRTKYIVFIKDGATSHTSNDNLDFLRDTFGTNILSNKSERVGGRDWAPGSPDLNVCDNFLWAYLKVCMLLS